MNRGILINSRINYYTGFNWDQHKNFAFFMETETEYVHMDNKNHFLVNVDRPKCCQETQLNPLKLNWIFLEQWYNWLSISGIASSRPSYLFAISTLWCVSPTLIETETDIPHLQHLSPSVSNKHYAYSTHGWFSIRFARIRIRNAITFNSLLISLDDYMNLRNVCNWIVLDC